MTYTLRSGGLTAGDDGQVPVKRRRRGPRIVLLTLASVIVLIGAVVAGSFVYINHIVGSIPRIPVKYLAQAAPSHGMTILIIESQKGPTDLTPAEASALQASGQTSNASGLVMLLHINSDNKAGGAVSIPLLTMVNVPGRGKMQIQWVDAVGGPSLLVETVSHLTGVPITQFAGLDFAHVVSMVNAEGGISVTLPRAAVSYGYRFHAGVNQVDGIGAFDYVRAPGLTETSRGLRQQALARAILSKLGNKHLLLNPLTMNRVLNALTGMLTVDSNFSNSQVERLATELGNLTSGAGTFVTAPTRVTRGSVVLKPAESKELWSAVKNDSIAAFAKKYPKTVTPAAP